MSFGNFRNGSMSALERSRTTTTTTDHTGRDAATCGGVASDSQPDMTTRAVSERATDRDGRQRRNAKWRRSSTLARDQHRPPIENQPVDVSQPSGKFLDQRRAEQSASNLERDSLVNSLANARLSSRVDTASTHLHSTRHSLQASISCPAPNLALKSSSFVTSSESSHPTHKSSVHTARIHNPRLSSSRAPIAPSRPSGSSTMDSDVIDLTLEDTEDELSVSDTLVLDRTTFNDQCDDPGPSRRTLSSDSSSPIALEHSLFTPPPQSRRRTRWVVDYLAVPSFPRGLTKADYQPMTDPSVVLPQPAVTTTPRDSSLADAKIANGRASNEAVTKADHQPSFDRPAVPLPAPNATDALTEAPDKGRGKECELDAVSPHSQDQQPSPADGTGVLSGAFLDALYEHTVIPLYDDDTYPPLNTLDLVSNTRFQFAHAWREHASKLREAELECMSKFNLLGKTCLWARSANASSPRLPGSAGYVSSEQLRPWELALPECLLQEKDTKDGLGEQPHAHTDDQADVDCLLLPEESLPGPSTVLDPALSNPTVSEGLVVAEVDEMHQYFKGLGDSPAKRAPPRLPFTPTHTFRPHLLQSAGHSGMNSLELGFSALEPDPRLVDTGNHECFLGVPPSPPPADVESSAEPGPIPDSPSRRVDYVPASPNNLFDPADAWSFEQGEGLVQNNDSPPSNHVTPDTPGTIDPSLLGLGQPAKELQVPNDSTPKQRSKLPEPVIYIRRPIDPSSLPLPSGRRSVQIKYRDSGGSPPTTLTRTGSRETPSNRARNSKQSRSDTDDLPQTKRRLVPSRKLREYGTVSESGSDHAPEPSTSKIKLKIKRPNFKDTGLAVDHQDVEAGIVPTMSCCHQCRNTSARPKMLCSNVLQGRVCGKRFCSRCILHRYPDITFDEHSAGFLCPVCTNTCNCSLCSRNRGEEFISMRLGGLAASLLKTKVTLVRDVDKPLDHAKSPPADEDAGRSVSARTTPTPEPSALPTPSKFWAHVYGMEGERVGSAFMTREQMERMQTGGSSAPPPLPKQAQKKTRKPAKRDKEREKPRGPRVFIGRPLDSWKVRVVRDLEPSIDVDVWAKGKGKGKEREMSDRPRRCYIGNPIALYEPYGRMPGTASPTPPPSSSRCSTHGLDLDGSLTPLPDLEAEADDWPQPEVGEYCSWAPPSPPGMVVHPGPPDTAGLSASFRRELRGPEVPGAVGAWPDVPMEAQSLGQGLASGSSVDMEMEVVEGPASSSTALSEEALARAISAALAALSVGASS